MIGANLPCASLIALIFLFASNSSADEAAAKQQFDRGRAAASAGDCQRALLEFSLSYGEHPTVGTLLNMSACEEKLGRLNAAVLHLAEALERADPADPRRPLIAQQLSDVRDRIPHVQLHFNTTLPPDATLTIDMRTIERSRWDAPIALDPGKHQLSCATPQTQLCEGSFSLTEREVAVWELVVRIPVAAQLPEAHTPVPMPAIGGGSERLTSASLGVPPNSVAPSRSRTVAIAVAALGAAVLAGGLVAGFVALHEKGVMSAHCDATGCDDDGMRAARAGSTLATWSTIAGIVGIGGLGAGAYVLWTSPNPPTAGLTLSGSF